MPVFERAEGATCLATEPLKTEMCLKVVWDRSISVPLVVVVSLVLGLPGR